jgi:hypothetical protein
MVENGYQYILYDRFTGLMPGFDPIWGELEGEGVGEAVVSETS